MKTPESAQPTSLPRTVAPSAGPKSLIVQGDRTVLLEVDQPGYADARDFLALFAELEKAPEHVHFYRITPISVWNAAAAGLELELLLAGLVARSRFPLPSALEGEIRGWFERYGLVRLEREDGALWLRSPDPTLLRELARAADVAPLITTADGGCRVAEQSRGAVKRALIRLGYPVDDLAGFRAGARLEHYALRERTLSGDPFVLRHYQREAARVFWAGGAARGGSGVIVLPCGAGKTIVALAAMDLLRTQTLVLTTNTVAVRQWRRELLDKTTLTEDDVGEYTGDSKRVCPVTVATYQILTYRRAKQDPFEHFALFSERDWGLIVYDEVHLLPAPVFRATAEIQARRRLGLTATLIREDGQESDVFSLIGPKRYDVPWKELETRGYIAEAHCIEVRVAMPRDEERAYRDAPARSAFKLASTNSRKLDIVGQLLARHPGDRVLIIGQYLDQLAALADRFGVPLITGRTRTAARERLYAQFRDGAITQLAVSKVGNFAVDLPDANIAIQISGAFGSRQEEAQRLGRILRPKAGGGGAIFYAVVSAGTRDQDFASKRQRFLAEQGYTYEIRDLPPVDWSEDGMVRGDA